MMQTKHIDLMMTDVGLPGMDGRELATQARKLRPELPILFASGYAESIEVPAGHACDRQAVFHRSVARQSQRHSRQRLEPGCMDAEAWSSAVV